MSDRQIRKQQRSVREAKQHAIRSAARSEPECVAELRHQVGFLKSSAAAYDAGNEAEAKRLASTIRLLVHDTGRSTSLLTQLKVKDLVLFLDTAGPVSMANMMTTMGLLMLQLRTTEGEPPQGSYLPVRSEGPRQHCWLPFAHWWDDPVSRLPQQDLNISRRDYVLDVADKEGGAHFDPEGSPIYRAISRDNGFNWTVGHKNEETGEDVNLGRPSNDPTFAAVRQVTFELIETFDAHLRPLIHDDLPRAA